MSDNGSMSLSTKYSDNQRQHNGKGHSFFDSVSQCIERLKLQSESSPKSLRDLCSRFARRNVDNEHSWLHGSLQREGLTICEYIFRLESAEYYLIDETAPALLKRNEPVWGKPDVEGRIICEELNLSMHVIKLTSVGKGRQEWRQQTINKFGFKSISASDVGYRDYNDIHLLNKDEHYFESILNRRDKIFEIVRENHVRRENLEKARRILCISMKAGIADETSLSCDEQLLDVQMRLKEFVSYFVKEFEAKLYSYFMIVEGEAKKIGKFSEKLSAGTGQATGGILGAALGSLIAQPVLLAKLLAQAGKLIGNELGDMMGCTKHEEIVAAVMDLVLHYVNNKEEMRVLLVEVGLDIFQSFEMQFISVTTSFGPLKAMQLLARDAVNRILRCDRSDHKGISISECVIFGESKTESVWGVPVPSSKLKTPGFKVHYITGEVWNTGSLFGKAGLMVEGMNSMQYYKRNDGQSKSTKYGYRRPLQTQNVDKIDTEYIKDPSYCENKFFKNYRYILKLENMKEISKFLLEEINSSDKKLSEERIKEVIKEGKDDILTLIGDMKECILQCSVDLKTLLSIETSLNDMNVEEYFKQLQNYLQDAKETLSGNLDNAHKHREVIAHDNKQEHEKTQAHIETVDKKIHVLRAGQETLIKHTTAAQKSIRFGVRLPVNSFIGREQELKNIADNIKQEIVVISGSSGIGKTELALKYICSEYIEQDNIILIDASNKTTVKHSFQRLAEKELGIHIKDNYGEEKSLMSVVKSIFNYFADKKCLFLFDNAEEYNTLKNILEISLNADSGEHLILITSDKRSEWERKSLNIKLLPPLKGFKNLEVVELFKAVLEMKADSDEEHDGIVQLAEKLNNHPLFVEHAAIYIKNEQKDCMQKDLGNHCRNYSKLLGDEKMTDAEIASKIWKIMIKKMERENYGPDALSMFSQIVYFKQENICEDLFSINNDDSDNVKSLIEMLKKYCIIRLDRGSIRIHGLIQEAIRLRLKQLKQEESTLEKALKLMQDHLIKTKGKTSSTPHHVSLWGYAKEYDALIANFIVQDDSVSKYFCIIAESSSDADVADIIDKIEQQYPNKLCDIINLVGRGGKTALHFAIRGRNEGTINLLIEKGADVNASDDSGHRPLHLAARYGLGAVVNTLLERKADVNCVTSDKYKLTPLHLAAHNGHKSVVGILLDNGADINARTQTRNTALHLASEKGHTSVVDVLLHQPKLDIEAENANNLTAHHVAAQKGHLGVVQLLLYKGANANAFYTYKHSTPLHFTEQYGNVNFVKKLIVHSNAKMDAQTKQGNTPLQLEMFLKKGPSKPSIDLSKPTKKFNNINPPVSLLIDEKILKLILKNKCRRGKDKRYMDRNSSSLKLFKLSSKL